MKQPAFCTLTPDEFRAQRERYLRVRPTVERVERGAGEARIAFAPGFDPRLVRELVETEQRCCPFFTIDVDEEARLVRIASDDPDRWDVIDGFAAVFSRRAA